VMIKVHDTLSRKEKMAHRNDPNLRAEELKAKKNEIRIIARDIGTTRLISNDSFTCH
jgi:hypothetical protein